MLRRQLGAWAGSTLLIVAALLLLSCSPQQSPAARDQPPTSGPVNIAGRPAGTLKIAYAREPETLSSKFLGGGGAGEFAWIFNSTLTSFDFVGVPHPMIAREIPSQENGGWVVNPDGTMVTTYQLRENARWHDGAPLTAADFVFAAGVYLDHEISVVNRSPEDLMARLEAPDPHTLVIRWKETFPGAAVLGYQQLNPLPRHLLEEKYRSNKANFSVGEEWTSAYVGSGPFKVDRWLHGSGIIAHAFEGWLLGPPKVETVEIRFIADRATILANLLSGEIDLSTSPAVRSDEAVFLRDQWDQRSDGYIKTWETRITFMDFQFREVSGWQRAVTDVRVRRGLMHALDRQALAEAVSLGLGSAADAFITRTDPLFSEVDRLLPKYPFDPNRALASFGEAGWRRMGSGSTLTNAEGQTLNVDIWSTEEKDASIIADSWKATGVNSVPYRIPQARQRDLEHRNSFPGTNTGSRSIHPENFDFVSDELPKAENGWLGSNRGSFVDQEVDRLHGVWTTSLREDERRVAQLALHKRMSELIGFGPLYYGVEVIIARNRVKGPIGNYGPQIGITWNIYEWEVSD